MEDPKQELIPPDNLMHELTELQKKIEDSKGDWCILEDTFANVRAQFEKQNKLRDDYREFFAALLQAMSENPNDRDVPVKSELWDFSLQLAARVRGSETARAALQQEQSRLDEEKKLFEQEKVDRAALVAGAKEEALREVSKELKKQQAELSKANEALEKVRADIREAEEELERKREEVKQFGSIPVPGGDRPQDMQKVLAEFDREGYVMPSDINPWGLYLCTPWLRSGSRLTPALR